MSFDYEQASDAELQSRIEKFKRRAPIIKTQAHLDKVLASFPPEQRADILNEAKPLLPFVPKEIA